jgi:hypothetical protein
LKQALNESDAFKRISLVPTIAAMGGAKKMLQAVLDGKYAANFNLVTGAIHHITECSGCGATLGNVLGCECWCPADDNLDQTLYPREPLVFENPSSRFDFERGRFNVRSIVEDSHTMSHFSEGGLATLAGEWTSGITRQNSGLSVKVSIRGIYVFVFLLHYHVNVLTCSFPLRA